MGIQVLKDDVPAQKIDWIEAEATTHGIRVLCHRCAEGILIRLPMQVGRMISVLAGMMDAHVYCEEPDDDDDDPHPPGDDDEDDTKPSDPIRSERGGTFDPETGFHV